MYKDLRHTGDEVDNAVDKVETGNVVIENTDSEILANSKKPVAGGTLYQALASKVERVSGKGLSTNDYTTEDKSRVGNSVTSIRVNGTTISRKDDTGLLDIGDVSNLYVADFTINDLHRLLYGGEIESLEVNGKALLQALRDHKAIGVLLENDVPSMSLASVYADDYIYLSFIHMNELYMASVALPGNYNEVDESKSGIIYMEEITVYSLDLYRQFFLDIVSDDVREAYLNSQEITCDYNSLRNAVQSHSDIRIQAGELGAVPVNAYLTDENTIGLSYIVGDNLWQMTIYRSEDEDGNVYGRVFGNEITMIDLIDTKKGSRYIIQDFTIENIMDNDVVTITSELVKAITDNRPLAIYYATSESNICDITEVSADLATRTRISLKVSYSGGGNLIIDSSNVVTEGGRIRASSYWEAAPNTRSIANSSGGTIPPDDGVITVPPSFFADKSVEASGNNPPKGYVPINNQITILNVPLTGNGTFMFQPPTAGAAVEYTIKFRANTQCAWSITNSGGSSLAGNFYGQTLSNISAGNYLMKITLYTYVNTKGIEQTEYIAEVMQMTK